VRPDERVPLDGFIVLPGGAGDGIDAVSSLSQDYPKARLAFSGFSAADKKLTKRLADLGVDPGRIQIEPRPRTTSEDALYSTALLKPKSGERWLLINTAMHMPRAVGCFRVSGFRVEPYPSSKICAIDNTLGDRDREYDAASITRQNAYIENDCGQMRRPITPALGPKVSDEFTVPLCGGLNQLPSKPARIRSAPRRCGPHRLPVGTVQLDQG
jgi:DUF218 domain